MRVRATRLFSIGAGGRRPDTSVFAGSLAAFSTRIPAGSIYNGPLVRVRRSSDNAETDIGTLSADANGDKFLDSAALLTFVGAGNGFVTVWYDQSGNARNVSQTTVNNQPRIVNAGVYASEINFSTAATANQGRLAFAALLTMAGYPYTTGSVVRKTATNPGIFFGNNTASSQVYRIDGTTSAQFAPGVAYGSTFNASVNVIATQTISAGNTATGWINGTSIGSSSSVSSAGLLVDGVATWATSQSFFAAKELVLFQGTVSTARRQALEQSQGAAYGISFSVFSNTAAAYSVRIPVGSNYTGPLLRVRRSNDNAELDIGAVATPDANGDRFLDTTALLAFTGANSGFVATWYDQSGNGRDVTQTTTANQPRIVNAGVLETVGTSLRPAVRFTGGNVGFSAPVAPTVSISDFGINLVHREIVRAGGAVWSLNNSGTPVTGLTPFLDGNLYFDVGGISGANRVSVATSAAVGTSSVITELNSVPLNIKQIVQNGVIRVTGTGTTGTLTVFRLGSDLQNGSNCCVGDVILFGNAPSTARRQALEQSQGTAYGITVV
jgi:hypothetical protein